MLAISAAATFIYIAMKRYNGGLSTVDYVLILAMTIWALPKLPIAIILLVRDVIKGFVWISKKITALIAWIRSMRVANGHPKAVAKEAAKHDPEEYNGSRRAFLAKAAWGTAIVPYALVGDGVLRTLYDFRVHTVEIVLPHLPRGLDGLRIVQLSDLHAGSFPNDGPFREAMLKVKGLSPDVVLITGDFVNARSSEMNVIGRDLEKLNAPLGVYASLGNHDHYNNPDEHAELIRGIRGLGVDLMINEHRRLRVGSDELIIAGTDNTGMKQKFARLDKALSGVAPGEPTILMAHDPTFWDAAIVGATDIDLTLSGHTHGGQFGVNVMGFEWSPAQYVYKQWAGHYRTGDQQLYINRGLGTVGPPIRIGIAPEITLFTLRALDARASRVLPRPTERIL
jgi:predicted MPP superfamily phosphohydrolase